MKYDELQEEKNCRGVGTLHLLQERDRKSYGSAILRQRPVALQVKVGCKQDGGFGDNKNHWEFFTQQMKEEEQLTLFIRLMQAHGILHLT